MLGLGNGITTGSFQESESFNVANVAGVATWLKATAGVTLDSGAVARWRDQVGSTDWVSNQSGNQPSTSGSGIDTHLVFDGADRLYQKEYAWNTDDDTYDFDFSHDVFDVMNAGGSGGFTTFFVLEFPASTTVRKNIMLQEAHFQDDGTPGSGFSARTDITGELTLYTHGDYVHAKGHSATLGTTAFNGGTAASAEFVTGQKLLITVEYAGGTSGAITLRVNGTNKALTNGNTATLGVITLGSLGASSTGFVGNLYELINVTSKLDPNERNKVEAYLTARHSIS